MAAPPNITCKNLNGVFVLNKLSDNMDALLALQGMKWWTRTAIGLATITLTIKTYTDASSTIHVDISSSASGLTTTQENRTLDWEEREHEDKVFGKCKGRSRLVTTSTSSSGSAPASDDTNTSSTKAMQFEAAQPYPPDMMSFLSGSVLKSGESSCFLEPESIQSYVKNEDERKGWTAEQLWNFEEVHGKRYHTRRIVVMDSAGKKSECVRLVYDYRGSGVDREDDGLAYGEGAD